MKKISQCCKAKRKIYDNWSSDRKEEDVRFTYVCSNCKKEFIEKQNGNK